MATGVAMSLPRIEYMPHDIPATDIKSAPVGRELRSPGSIRWMRPPSAAIRPTHCASPSVSPDFSTAPVIVICTAPKSISVPMPMLSETYAREMRLRRRTALRVIGVVQERQSRRVIGAGSTALAPYASTRDAAKTSVPAR